LPVGRKTHRIRDEKDDYPRSLGAIRRQHCSQYRRRKRKILEEIVKMLFKMLDQLGCRIAEDSGGYGETTDQEVEEEED
jgi:hypothetical protein